MRLAESILAGSTIVKRYAGLVLRPASYGGVEGCAIGMGAVATGYKGVDHAEAANYLREAFPFTANEHLFPCACTDTGKAVIMVDAFTHRYTCRSKATVSQIIAHLFDIHVMAAQDWTLEQLCDWVDSVDPTPREVTVESAEKTSAEIENLVALKS